MEEECGASRTLSPAPDLTTAKEGVVALVEEGHITSPQRPRGGGGGGKLMSSDAGDGRAAPAGLRRKEVCPGHL
jgi:hypothetical protein